MNFRQHLQQLHFVVQWFLTTVLKPCSMLSIGTCMMNQLGYLAIIVSHRLTSQRSSISRCLRLAWSTTIAPSPPFGVIGASPPRLSLLCDIDFWMNASARVSMLTQMNMPSLKAKSVMVTRRMNNLSSLMVGRISWRSYINTPRHLILQFTWKCTVCTSLTTALESPTVKQLLQLSGKLSRNPGVTQCLPEVLHISILCVHKNSVMLVQWSFKWSWKLCLSGLTSLQMMCPFSDVSDGTVITRWLWRQHTCVIIRQDLNYCLTPTLMNGAILDMEFHATCTLSRASPSWPIVTSSYLVPCSKSSSMTMPYRNLQHLLSRQIFRPNRSTQPLTTLALYKND